MSDYGSDKEEPELDLSNSDVVTKYKAAAEITNNALATVLKAIKAGVKLVDLCQLGDSSITQAVAKVFNKKNLEKGIAFPTCVSLNNTVGHYSALQDDPKELKNGDVVKVDLGTHIDGFIAVAAHTVVVQEDAQAPITGKAAKVLAAANTGLEAALRLFRPGKSIGDIAPILQKIVEAHGCTLVEGVLSHQLKQYIIDGNKCVLNKPTPEAKVENEEFEENEVYAIDIVVSTGEGKSRVTDEKETTVYRRALDEQPYSLKLKASRSLFSEISKKYSTMPFSVRELENKQTRLGLVECLNHNLLHPYPVLHEKAGELVAQFKATVLLMPNGSDRVTTAPMQKVEADVTIEDAEIKNLLVASLKTKKKPKKKPAKSAEGTEAVAMAE